MVKNVESPAEWLLSLYTGATTSSATANLSGGQSRKTFVKRRKTQQSSIAPTTREWQTRLASALSMLSISMMIVRASTTTTKVEAFHPNIIHTINNHQWDQQQKRHCNLQQKQPQVNTNRHIPLGRLNTGTQWTLSISSPFASPEGEANAATKGAKTVSAVRKESTVPEKRATTPLTPPPNSSSSSSNSSPYYVRPGSMMAATAARGSVPYGEDSRQFRRTIYTADDWIRHRNSERILTNLYGLFFSGIVRQLQQELLLVCLVSTAVVVINNHTMGIFGNLEISLPSLPFQLSSPALGLLLVFRTNASYSRWTEGRATWARIDANSCNMIRMAATFTDLTHCSANAMRERQAAIRQLSLATWAYSRSLMNQLLTVAEDEEDYCAEMRATFGATANTTTSAEHDNTNTSKNNNIVNNNKYNNALVERILNAPDRTVAALTQVSLALDRLPIDEKRRVEVDKSIVILGDCLSTCERIYSSPVPLVYTRHTGRFLSFWMLLLPAALYEPFVNEDASGIFLWQGFSVVPAVAVVAIFLFGIEELAVALEEPFSILPMKAFCDGIKQSMDGIMDWCFESARLENSENENAFDAEE